MGRLKERDMVVHTFDVEFEEGNTLEAFDSMLRRYKQWSEFKRDVRITGLLNQGKKVQFDIEDANLLVYTDTDAIQYIHKAAFRTDTITFIIKDEQLIDVKISGEILPSQMGQTIKSILDAELEVTVRYYDNKRGHKTLYFNHPESDKAA